MLVLTRKLMEKLFIGDDICVTVVRLEGGQVRLGIDAPREVAGRPGRAGPRAGSAPRLHIGPAAPTAATRIAAELRHAHHPWLMEPIADAADGLDEVGGIAQLLAQALDVDVDRPLQDHGVLADGGVHQLEAGERPARLPEQHLQQAKLGRGQRQLLVAIEVPGGCAGRSRSPGSRTRPRRPAPPPAGAGGAPS